jgi:tetratricopeptide (TPR) repeat protein
MTSRPLQDIEALVRSGRLTEAQQALESLPLSSIPREASVLYANLARRAGLGQLALRILNPIIRSKKPRQTPATPQEKIEYAATLRQQGMIDEAAELLEEIDLSAHPQGALQRALCHFSQWQYGPAIPLLQSYVASFSEPTYARTVGKLNLIDALIAENQTSQAREAITGLSGDFSPSESPLLELKCLELTGRLEIDDGKLSRATTAFEKARHLLRGTPGFEESTQHLYIDKWLAVSRSLEAGKALPELGKVREAAIARREWEVVRDCEFYLARLGRKQAALLRIYFGSPTGGYRHRIEDALGAQARIPDTFAWSGEFKAEPKLYFDLVGATGHEGGPLELTAGQAQHRLMILLTRDFYRASTLLGLFSQLFPGEHFNPDSSPGRVQQVLKRFRSWLNRSGLPIELEVHQGSYRLNFKAPCSLIVPKTPLPLMGSRLEFESALHALGPSTRSAFTTRDVQYATLRSESAVKRLLKWAVQEGLLTREGASHRACYRLPSNR